MIESTEEQMGDGRDKRAHLQNRKTEAAICLFLTLGHENLRLLPRWWDALFLAL